MTADPVARQVVLLEQETPSRLVTPLGTVCGVQVLPPFVVFRIAAWDATEEEPTAVQTSPLEQEIAAKSVTVEGMGSDDQVVPPLVVTMMLGASSPELKSLTAWQVEALSQETAVSSPTPAGMAVSAVQVVPESDVPIMTGFPNIPKPTAVQTEVVGHEIPFRPLTSEGITSVLQA
jgi:hypothetical protein